MDGLGKGLAFSQNFRTCAALGNGMGGDGVFTRVRLAFADAHFKCISVQVSTAGGIALNAPQHEKGSAASRAAQRGKASEHMTTKRESGMTYFAF